MKRTFAALSVLFLAFTLTIAAYGQSASSPTKPERLSKQQLNTLIVSAKTPAEHERIAQYYRAKAQDYLAQAKEHESMIAMYKANPALSNDKNQASTINHCEYFVTTFKALADNSQDLAAMHERMAKEAPGKLTSAGK
jgi:hypothetical protein